MVKSNKVSKKTGHILVVTVIGLVCLIFASINILSIPKNQDDENGFKYVYCISADPVDCDTVATIVNTQRLSGAKIKYMQSVLCPTDFADVWLAFIGGSDAQRCILLAKASGAKTALAKEMLGGKAAYGAEYSYEEGLLMLSQPG